MLLKNPKRYIDIFDFAVNFKESFRILKYQARIKCSAQLGTPKFQIVPHNVQESKKIIMRSFDLRNHVYPI